MDALVLAFGIVFVYVMYRAVTYTPREMRELPRTEKQERETTIRELIGHHLPTLSRRRRQLVVTDAYGIENTTRWDKETDRFCEGVILPAVTVAHTVDWLTIKAEASRWIDAAIKASGPSEKPPKVSHLSPVEYEALCGDRLKGLGWSVRLTAASGDQGADVIAEKDGVRVVLQCKLYGRPVGNKAVQEVLAAQQFEDARHSVVVSPAAYTTSAMALAQKTGVLLLHHDELERVNDFAPITAEEEG